MKAKQIQDDIVSEIKMITDKYKIGYIETERDLIPAYYEPDTVYLTRLHPYSASLLYSKIFKYDCLHVVYNECLMLFELYFNRNQFKELIAGDNNVFKTCMICMEEQHHTLGCARCSFIMCPECKDKLLKKECPQCKKLLT